KVFGLQDCVRATDGGVMMSVARRGHGEPALEGIIECGLVVPFQCASGVEDFDRINRELVQNVFPDAGAEKVVRVGRNCEPALFMNQLTDLQRASSFQIREHSADAEKMPFGSCYF